MYPHQKEFERAIECACEPGLCKDDELYQLAQLLESYDKDDDETKYEDQEEDEDRKQERVDRQDVADILRADAALQLRLVYLNEVNIFKERVEEIIKKKNKNNNNDDDDRDKGSSMTWHTMIRAVECASQRGLCKDSRELNRLADALEAYKGCLVEEDCDQEQIDRQDVVDILRMQSSLQLRQVYLKDVNIFKERVDQAASSSDASPSEDDLPWTHDEWISILSQHSSEIVLK